SSFTLKNGGSNTNANLTPGNYSVSEQPLESWTLTSAGCDNGNNPGAITLTAGQTVVCMFTNTFTPPVAVTCVVISAFVGLAITPIGVTATGGNGGPYTYSATGM